MAKLAIKGGRMIRDKAFCTWPISGERELSELVEVLKSGDWSYHARKHEKQTEFAEKFARFHDAKCGVCTSSGTTALEVSLRAAGVEPGDEVIVPALTFVSSASAALLIGAVPVFVDVDPDSYCIDVAKVIDAITERTRAIVPVHLYCNIADMDGITEVARENDLAVVEDCAHAHGSKWRGKGVGSIGTLGCFSFQQSKVMTAGEGGIIITSDESLEELCTSFIDCGRVRKSDRYAQNTLAWNYRMTEFQAAVLLGQLQRLPEQIRRREKNAEHLSAQVKRIEGMLPLERDDRTTTRSYYYYILRYDRESFDDVPKDRFVAALRFEGIPCDPVYEPVYKSPLFRMDPHKWPLCWGLASARVDYDSVCCPVAERACYEEGLAIPHTVLLGEEEDVDDVVAAIEKIKENVGELHEADSHLVKAIRAARRYAARRLERSRT